MWSMAELFAATGDGVARITRHGDEWTVALTLHGSGAQCLTLDPHHPGTLFVGSHGKGVWKSSDGGAHWQDMQLPQPDVFSVAVSAADGSRDRHYPGARAVAPADPDCWYVSASPGPDAAHNRQGNAQAYIYRWRGDGPWQALDGGLPQPLTSMPYALAMAPGELYAGLADGRLYRSRDGGDSWQQLALRGDPLPCVLALACVP